MANISLDMIRKLENSPDDAESHPDNPSLEHAFGRYQIQVGTAKTYGFSDASPENLKDPVYNTRVASKIVDTLNRRYTDDKAALIAYNGGDGMAKRWMDNSKNDDVLPLQTRNYVGRANLPRAAAAPAPSDIEQRIAKARADGYSWSDIESAFQDRIKGAKDAGFSDDEIRAAFGETSPKPVDDHAQDHVNASLAAADPGPANSGDPYMYGDNPFHAFFGRLLDTPVSRFIRSMEGLPALPPYKDTGNETLATHIAGTMGNVFGDAPVAIPAAGLTIASGGSDIAVGAAAFGAPAFVRHEYNDAIQNGRVKSPGEFVARQAGVVGNTAIAAGTGAATVLTGGLGASGARLLGGNVLAQGASRLAGEFGALTGVDAALQGHWPTARDLIDNAVLLAGFKGVTYAGGKAYGTIKKNLGDYWARTGVHPDVAAQAAITDPILRQRLQTVAPPKAEAGDSVSRPRINAFTIQEEHEREVQQLETEAMQGAKNAPKTGPAKPSPEFQRQLEARPLNGEVDEPDLLIQGSGDAAFRPRPYLSEDAEAREAKRLEDEAFANLIANVKPSGASMDEIASLHEESDTNMFQRVWPDAYRKLVEQSAARAQKVSRTPYDPVGPQTEVLPGLPEPEEFGKPSDKGATKRTQARLTSLPAAEPYKTPTVLPEEPTIGEQLNENFPQHVAAMKRAVTRTQRMIHKAVRSYVPDQPDPYAHIPVDEVPDEWKGALKTMKEGTEPTPEEEAARAKLEKAATANVEGDPWKIVGDRIARSEATPLKDRIKNTAYQVYLEMMDPAHPLANLNRAVANGEPLRDGENPEFLHRLAENTSTRAMWAIEHGIQDENGNVLAPGLQEIYDRFKPGDETHDFEAYATARWAMEKAGQDKETGVDLSASAKVIEEGKDRFEQSFKDLVAFQNATLRPLVRAGIINGEAYRTLVEQNRARVPGYRFEAQPREVPGAAKGVGRTGSPLKKFEGSDKRIRPIIETIMQDTFKRMMIADRAEINNAAAKAAEEAGVASKAREGKAMGALSLDDLDLGPITDTDSALQQVVQHHLQAEEVPTFNNGVMTPYVFADANMARVLRGFDKPTLSAWSKMAASITRVTRNLIVLNPLFPLRILTYDHPFQAITNPENRNVLASDWHGLRAIFKDPAMYDRWVRSGGADHVFTSASQDKYVSQIANGHYDPDYNSGVWNAIKTPFQALQWWSRTVGTIQPLGRFARGVTQLGESDVKAAYASTDAKFHRPGAGGPVGKAMNMVQPFTTAYINGLNKTFRAFTGRDFTGNKVMSAKDVMTNHAMALALVTLPMIANWYENKDEDWYKAAPDWQKDNGLFFGTNATGHVYIKLPPVISWLYGGLPRRLMAAYHDSDPHAFDMDKLVEGTAGSFAPPGGLLTYNVALPIIEHMANHSFFRGAPLVSDDEKRDVLTPEQSTPYTSHTAIELSRFLNDIPLVKGAGFSPAVVDNYIADWGGSLGMAAITTGERLSGVRDTEPAPHIEDWPLVSSWTSRYPSASAQPIKDFRNRLTTFNQVHGSLVKALEADDFGRFQQILADHPKAAAAHAFKLRQETLAQVQENVPDMQKYEKALNDAAQGMDADEVTKFLQAQKALENGDKYAKVIRAAKGVPSVEKRQMLDDLFATMQTISEGGIQHADKAGVQ